MANPIVHFEIAGDDAGKLHTFYRDLFGWTIDADNPMKYGFVKTAEGGLGGGILQGHGPMTRYVTIYAQVPSLEKHLEKVESLGGKTMVPPTSIPNGGRFAMFSDPAGNAIGLFEG